MHDDGIMNVNLVSFRSSYYQSNIEKSLHHPLEDIFYVSCRFLWHKKPLFLESISAKCFISAYFTVIGLFAKHTFSESGRSCVLSFGIQPSNLQASFQIKHTIMFSLFRNVHTYNTLVNYDDWVLESCALQHMK